MNRELYMMYFKTTFGIHVAGVFDSLKATEEAILSQDPSRRKYYVVEMVHANTFYPEFSSADHIREIRRYDAEGFYEGENLDQFVPFESNTLAVAAEG